ncbi:hypothetical protein [Singulisphaera sp. PoT]|uniref:hypothetical protein n=1 Tax=Singulisphaera sp. PoT TaxID=3411797 RepID=UPI003BF4DBBF
MNIFKLSLASLVVATSIGAAVQAAEVKAGAAAKNLTADDSLVIGGGIGPHKVMGQEGELRASAIVVEDPKGQKVCLVACDVLMVNRDILDRAAKKIEKETGIPFSNILINATHTHHAPTTCSIHGYVREEAFTLQLEEKIVEAAIAASKKLVPVTMSFRLGEESSVGKNSRLLLSNGMIFWTGSMDDVVRPTGPFDPELPVWAFQRADGSYEAVLFNHSTHTIGTSNGNVRSPSFYGLTAQGLEKEKGGTFIFFEGASGSTHNLGLTNAEATLRITQAVKDALGAAKPHNVHKVKGIRSEFSYKVRKFDEAKDDKAVVDYEAKMIKDPKVAQFVVDIFRDMRKQLAPVQGQERKTWIQAIQIGDTAVVGVPGEFFTVLGEDIKRRSPFRYTYVFELANDYIGYIPDKLGMDRGGYQTWTGLHSHLERGAGEAIVDEAVKLLEQLHAEDTAK